MTQESPARSGSGRIRNVSAMTDEKLQRESEKLVDGGWLVKDPEGSQKFLDEMQRRSLTFDDDRLEIVLF